MLHINLVLGYSVTFVPPAAAYQLHVPSHRSPNKQQRLFLVVMSSIHLLVSSNLVESSKVYYILVSLPLSKLMIEDVIPPSHVGSVCGFSQDLLVESLSN